MNNKRMFVIFCVFILIGLSFYFKTDLMSGDTRQSFTKEKGEVLSKDGKAYLYRFKEEKKDKEEKEIGRFWYIATNQKLEEINFSEKNKFEKVSENVFWDPEHCAQMLTLTTPEHLYFLESRFKEGSVSDFYDVIYKFNIKENSVDTYKSNSHLNIYSLILENQKIKVFYKDNETQKFYVSDLEELGDKIKYTNTQEIKEEDIVYREWKGNIEELDRAKDLQYFIVQ